MVRPFALVLFLVLLVGCDSAEDGPGSALLDVTVETPVGTPVEGLSLAMEYALGSGIDGGGARVARSTVLRYFAVYASGDGRFDAEWETEDEEGVALFVVEAGPSADDLEDAAEIEPHGTSEPYTVEVAGAYALFRLRIEFADGDVEHSEVVEPIGVAGEDSPAYPGRVRLHAGYPNPFFDATVLGFTVPRATGVVLEVLDLEGRPVRGLVRDERPAGQHRTAWEPASDFRGGFYRVRLIAEDDTASVMAVYTGGATGPQGEWWTHVRTTLGETDASGRFSTEERALFPQLYPEAEAEFRDENNVMLGVFRPSREITLVLRDGTGKEQRFGRRLSGGSNAFALTWDPD